MTREILSIILEYSILDDQGLRLGKYVHKLFSCFFCISANGLTISTTFSPTNGEVIA